MKHVIGCMAVLAGLGLLAGNWTHETTMWIGGMCQAADDGTPPPPPKKPDNAPKGAYDLPRFLFTGTPKDLRVSHLRPKRNGPTVFPTIPTAAVNLAAKKPVTSSDSEPTMGALNMLTDGDKEGAEGSYVELGPGKQWVQVDLGQAASIHVIHFWHYHAEGRVYRDVVVQVADDADFITNVRTVFNNDYDNSSGLGIGKDLHYVESYEGEAVPAGGAKARYVRLYSHGNTSNDQNHYIEVEVWGLPSK